MDDPKYLVAKTTNKEGAGYYGTSPMVVFGLVASEGKRKRVLACDLKPGKLLEKAFQYQLKHLGKEVRIVRFYPSQLFAGWPWVQSVGESLFLFAIGEQSGRAGYGTPRNFKLFWATHRPDYMNKWLADAVQAGSLDLTKIRFRIYKKLATLTAEELYELVRNRNYGSAAEADDELFEDTGNAEL